MATITESFHIRGDDPVRVTLKIGNGQLGGFSAMLGPDELSPASTTASRAVYDLGRGSAVRFQIFFASVLVKDVNPSTDETIVTAEVQQASKVMTFAQNETAPAGGIVNYAVAILFE
jgi:hypothetical protein